MFESLLGDGSQWGIRLAYAEQPDPGGLAQAFLIGKEFVGRDPSCLILGDNIFYGHGLVQPAQGRQRCARAAPRSSATGSRTRSATASRSSTARAGSLAWRKSPREPKSNYAVTGLYFYDNQVVRRWPQARAVRARGVGDHRPEQRLSRAGRAAPGALGRGIAWLDTGTHESLMQAGNFIETIEKRQGLKVCCPEEIAFNNRWIDAGLSSAPSPKRCARAAMGNIYSACCTRGWRRERHRDPHPGVPDPGAQGVRGRARLLSGDLAQATAMRSWVSPSDWSRTTSPSRARGMLRGLHCQYPTAGQAGPGIAAARCSTWRWTSGAARPTSGSGWASPCRGRTSASSGSHPGSPTGSCVTGETALFAYKCSDFYHPETEFAIRWDDPRIGIEWPLERSGEPRSSRTKISRPRLPRERSGRPTTRLRGLQHD